MKVSIRRASAMVIGGLVAACASGGGGGGAISWNVGQATASDAQQRTVDVLRQYQFDIEREEGPPSIYIITRWRNRQPFADEQELGVVEARTRFIVEARRGSQMLYTVRLRVENEGREVGAEFERLDATPAFRSYASELVEDLRSVYVMGIRG